MFDIPCVHSWYRSPADTSRMTSNLQLHRHRHHHQSSQAITTSALTLPFNDPLDAFHSLSLSISHPRIKGTQDQDLCSFSNSLSHLRCRCSPSSLPLSHSCCLTLAATISLPLSHSCCLTLAATISLPLSHSCCWCSSSSTRSAR